MLSQLISHHVKAIIIGCHLAKWGETLVPLKVSLKKKSFF